MENTLHSEVIAGLEGPLAGESFCAGSDLSGGLEHDASTKEDA